MFSPIKFISDFNLLSTISANLAQGLAYTPGRITLTVSSAPMNTPILSPFLSSYQTGTAIAHLAMII